MKKKSDAFAAFKHYKAYAENQLGVKIKATHDDKGGEYMSKEWDQFCAAAGIHRQHTIKDEPHQNGVAERANRTPLVLKTREPRFTTMSVVEN